MDGIAAECAHLAAARTALRCMYEEVVTTETPLSDAEETDEIWHNTVYQQARARRAQALVDFPDVPLFFGRLDYQPGAGDFEWFHIGRRQVRDQDGQPLVIDWRAPVSIPPCACKALRAPARLPSACTGWRTYSSPKGNGWAAPAGSR